MSAADIRDLLERAELAEKAGRRKDMAKSMKTVIEMKGRKEGLTAKERKLFSNAYENLIDEYRSSWRIITMLDDKETTDGTDQELLTEYKLIIEKDLKETCNEVVHLLDKYLLASVKGNNDDDLKAKILYNQMKGDHYSYLFEVTKTLEERKSLPEKGHEAYASAYQAAKVYPPTNSIRLCVALNFSIFLYEIMNDTTKAVALADEAFNDAMDELHYLKEEDYEETSLIINKLRDKVQLWTSTPGEENDEESDYYY